jgi:Xaa-Pro aminopeptidase
MGQAKAKAKVKEAFSLLQRMRQAIAAAIKPGARACEVYRAGAAFRERQGLRSSSGLGHGLGIECHEPPLLSPDDETVLEEGMVIVIELVDGIDGVSFLLEDGGLVTTEGWQSLTHLTTDLIEIEV